MNRQDRHRIANQMTKLVTKIASLEQTWKDRHAAFGACLWNWQQLGASQTDLEELGGELARRLVNHFDAPPIGDVQQMTLYATSSDPVHRAAANGWQFTHQDAMRELQAQHPELDMAHKPAEPVYLVNLRHSIFLALEGERTPPTIALTHLARTLAGYHRMGWLVGDLEHELVAPHGMETEVCASFLRGRLRPVDAEAELALQDLLEQTEREASDALRMFYMLAGRPYHSAEV